MGDHSTPSLPALLPLAGLASGVLTICVANLDGQIWGLLVPGTALGVALSICFIVRTQTPSSVVLRLVPLTIAAYVVALLAGGVVQLLVPEQSSMGEPVSVSLLALFTAGAFSGYVLLRGVPLLVAPNLKGNALELEAMVFSLLGGALGLLGWALGPSLGIRLWAGLHRLGLTQATETLNNARFGDTGHQLSLFLVWQTGIAILPSVVFRRYEVSSQGRTSRANG